MYEGREVILSRSGKESLIRVTRSSGISVFVICHTVVRRADAAPPFIKSPIINIERIAKYQRDPGSAVPARIIAETA